MVESRHQRPNLVATRYESKDGIRFCAVPALPQEMIGSHERFTSCVYPIIDRCLRGLRHIIGKHPESLSQHYWNTPLCIISVFACRYRRQSFQSNSKHITTQTPSRQTRRPTEMQRLRPSHFAFCPRCGLSFGPLALEKAESLSKRGRPARIP